PTLRPILSICEESSAPSDASLSAIAPAAAPPASAAAAGPAAPGLAWISWRSARSSSSRSVGELPGWRVLITRSSASSSAVFAAASESCASFAATCCWSACACDCAVVIAWRISSIFLASCERAAVSSAFTISFRTFFESSTTPARSFGLRFWPRFASATSTERSIICRIWLERMTRTCSSPFFLSSSRVVRVERELSSLRTSLRYSVAILPAPRPGRTGRPPRCTGSPSFGGGPAGGSKRGGGSRKAFASQQIGRRVTGAVLARELVEPRDQRREAARPRPADRPSMRDQDAGAELQREVDVVLGRGDLLLEAAPALGREQMEQALDPRGHG